MWATYVIMSVPLRPALLTLAHMPPESVAHFTGIRNTFIVSVLFDSADFD